MSKAIKISDKAYEILETLSHECEKPVSDIASILILNKDKEIKLSEKTVKVIEIN